MKRQKPVHTEKPSADIEADNARKRSPNGEAQRIKRRRNEDAALARELGISLAEVTAS